ncbi:MAG: phenylacetic acid degradation bifunctional protein PaaZ [Saprospiraceae bacterium]|uniref:Phenylacetic acid degradation bifunctional protein PaaZ n=1 Tax=Candidatus Opimibacter skivensis TaxID=2982028 RepID=A0A9D7XVF2_9BACT|nr:phenylacetic acid degradation bifunctional protein PaaZ [Candidatus Opimibacter skivensis]
MGTQLLENYIQGKWEAGDGKETTLLHAIHGNPVARSNSGGVDFASILEYGRKVGGPPLRKMTFHERGRMIKSLALYLHERREKYYPISYQTGATKADSWIDIEGGIGNLFSNASLRRRFPDLPYHVDGEAIQLSKTGNFIGHHIMVPRQGIAIHINAFNFPIWGMLEKIAVNLLAGVPALVKPATLSSYVAEAMFRDIIASGILPEGAVQLLIGSAHGILDSVQSQDLVTFTGSASTGLQLKAHPRIISEAVPFNLEADSLNCTVLGEDAVPGTPEFELFVKEVRKEMTTKCGQRCTGIRRALVPAALLDDVQIALGKALSQTTIGDPNVEGVRMGALAGKSQVEEVRNQIKKLLKESSIAYGDIDHVELVGADATKGAFFSPVLLVNEHPLTSVLVHEVEAFGPVCTLMPYKNLNEAIEISKMGKGSLCSSITTHDDHSAKQFVIGAASHHGRILVLNRDCAKENTGHGSPLPMLTHGGPGRAGGGEEMGGMRGVLHYLQRCAIQGTPTTITEITSAYQYGGQYKDPGQHPFRKYFEDLQIGDTIITHKRTITEADIVNFANVSWDHFYAHTDATSLEGTIFTQRVAHGYFVLSMAAGLFVDPGKGPVILNYGLEECRFTKPVYPGMTLGVRLSVKEKLPVDPKDEDDIPKGIVKFLVDVYDETGETVAIATILTMVKKKA